MKYLLLLLLFSCQSATEIQSKILMVADHLENCVGVAPRSCMLVKESPEQDWALFYDRIEGFDYEEGFTYELLVEVTPVENPPADASSIRYELRNIIAKTPSPNKSELLGEWVVIKVKDLEQLSSSPTLIFEDEASKVSGFAGCNNYFSSYTLEGNMLSFGPAGSTRKLCQDMSVEDTFIKTLAQITRYEIVKKEIYFYDQNDQTLIIAIAQ